MSFCPLLWESFLDVSISYICHFLQCLLSLSMSSRRILAPLLDFWDQHHLVWNLPLRKIKIYHKIGNPWQLFNCHGLTYSASGQLQEVCLMQILANYVAFPILCHVKFHVSFHSWNILWTLRPSPPRVKLDGLWPFRPMRDLTMQWSLAFTFVCELAPRPKRAHLLLLKGAWGAKMHFDQMDGDINL